MKKNKLQDFLKNDIIDFEKIQNLYFETKNDNSRSEKIPSYFLEVVEVFSLNSIIKEFKSYYDFYPFLNARRFMKLFIGYYNNNAFYKMQLIAYVPSLNYNIIINLINDSLR